MEIEEGDYTLTSLLEYLSNKGFSVLSEEDARKEIKIFYYLSSITDLNSLFSEYDTEWLGEVLLVKVPYTIEDSETGEISFDNYYVTWYKPQILIALTSTTLERHEKKFSRKLKSMREITDMWIRPPIFHDLLQNIEERYPTLKITNFVAKRNPTDQTECKIRPNENRRINYTGQDGREVLKELHYQYGVHPTSVKCTLIPSIEISIYEDGYFILRTVNNATIDEMLYLVSSIEDDVLRLFNIANESRFDITEYESNLGIIRSPSISAAEIGFGSTSLTEPMIRELFSEPSDFSFLRLIVEEGSLNLSATVIDEVKGTFFDLSGTENSMILIPKSQSTFESFIRFYRFVTVSIDNKASFSSVV